MEKGENMEDFETREQEREMLDRAWGTYQIELDKKLRRLRKFESIKDVIIFMVVGMFIMFILKEIGVF